MIIIAAILTLLSCSSSKTRYTKIVEDRKNVPIVVPQQYKKSIYEKGDIKAYEAVKKLFAQKGESYEVLFYSMMMANRHHYKPAYFDVYICLWQAFNMGKRVEIWDMTRFDPKTREMALYYLELSAKNGNSRAKEILLKQYLEQ